MVEQTCCPATQRKDLEWSCDNPVIKSEQAVVAAAGDKRCHVSLSSTSVADSTALVPDVHVSELKHRRSSYIQFNEKLLTDLLMLCLMENHFFFFF